MRVSCVLKMEVQRRAAGSTMKNIHTHEDFVSCAATCLSESVLVTHT